MKYPFRNSLMMSACLVACVALSATALAEDRHDLTQFGHDISIGPNDNVGEATCFGCSIRVRGHVATDATAMGGSVIIEDYGQVDGDATALGGGIRLDQKSRVGGDLTVFGGELRRDPEASVGGDVTHFSGWLWMFLIFGLPFAILGAFVALVIWVVRRLIRPAVPVTA